MGRFVSGACKNSTQDRCVRQAPTSAGHPCVHWDTKFTNAGTTWSATPVRAMERARLNPKVLPVSVPVLTLPCVRAPPPPPPPPSVPASDSVCIFVPATGAGFESLGGCTTLASGGVCTPVGIPTPAAKAPTDSPSPTPGSAP